MPNLDEIGKVGVTVDRDWISEVTAAPLRTDPDGAPEAPTRYWGELEYPKLAVELDRVQKKLIIAGEDNWKHRSKGMLCGTCMYFVSKAVPCFPEGGNLGRCRRHAPTMSGWPAVFKTDWCGDFKIDETKV